MYLCMYLCMFLCMYVYIFIYYVDSLNKSISLQITSRTLTLCFTAFPTKVFLGCLRQSVHRFRLCTILISRVLGLSTSLKDCLFLLVCMAAVYVLACLFRHLFYCPCWWCAFSSLVACWSLQCFCKLEALPMSDEWWDLKAAMKHQ